MKQRVSHQIRMADIVVINKTDLIETGIKKIREEIKKANPFTEIRETTYCNIDFELGDSAIKKFFFDEVKTLSSPNVNSMVIKSGRKLSRKSLELFLFKWSPKAFRIKGFVNLKEDKTVAIQCTFDSVEIIEMENNFHPTELVAISHRFTLREWNKSLKEFS